MTDVGKQLGIPTVITEQYPKAFGSTVSPCHKVPLRVQALLRWYSIFFAPSKLTADQAPPPSTFAHPLQVAELPLNEPDYPVPRFEKKLFSMLTDDVRLPDGWNGHTLMPRDPRTEEAEADQGDEHAESESKRLLPPRSRRLPPPQVKTHLVSLEKQAVVLFGIEAHVCVQQTALDLLEHGYEVHILVDGVSSQKALDRAVALKVRGVAS